MNRNKKSISINIYSIIKSIRNTIYKPSRPLTSKKGKKGYDRKREKKKEKEWEKY